MTSLSMKIALNTLNDMSVYDANNADIDDLMFIAAVFRDNCNDDNLYKFLSILVSKFWGDNDKQA